MEQLPSPNYTPGRPRGIRAIVIHWWGNPADHPSFNGVVAHLRNPASQVSAHYVVGQGRKAQLVSEDNQAWHARQANTDTIGIEVDPNADENTYRMVGELVADIRRRRGNLPLEKHSQHVATACPGTINLNKINDYANNKEEVMPIDLYTKRRIDYSVNGMNGLNGRPNALNGERDDVLNANWNTDFTPEWLQGVFDSPQAQEYRQKLESGEYGVEFVEIEGPVYKKKES